MRVVLDTNVLVAAQIARGLCHEVVEHCARFDELFTSEFILEEFHRILTRKLRYPTPIVEFAVELPRSRAQIVQPLDLAEPVSADPDDDVVLGTALAARAEVLVSGDRDLLDLIEHEGIQILSPSDFWRVQAESL